MIYRFPRQLLCSVSVLATLWIGAAALAADKKYSVDNFEVTYPDGWTVHIFNPDSSISLRGPRGVFCLLNVYTGPIDPKKSLDDLRKITQRAYNTVSKPQEFNRFGTLQGIGTQFRAMLGGNVPTTFRAFAYTSPTHSLVAQESLSDPVDPEIAQQIAAIERSFVFKKAPELTGEDRVSHDLAQLINQAKAATTLGQLKAAEHAYMTWFTLNQLNRGFGDPMIPQVLETLGAIYKAEHKYDQAEMAEKMAKSLRSGALPRNYVGTAELSADGNSMMLRKRLNKGALLGDAFITLRREDIAFDPTYKLLDGIAPGETKLLPPWPQVKEPNGDPREMSCALNMANNQMIIIQEPEYIFETALGVQTEKVHTPDNVAPHLLAHAMDAARKWKSHTPEFLQAYLTDAAAMSLNDHIRYAFCLQPKFGANETYAVVYEATKLRRQKKQTPEHERLLTAFPAVTKFMESELDDIEKNPPPQTPAPSNKKEVACL